MEEEEDSQADGFVVDDGYLSEGEGRPMYVDEFEAGLEGISLATHTVAWLDEHCSWHCLSRILVGIVRVAHSRFNPADHCYVVLTGSSCSELVRQLRH